jgi:tRNA(fMet)-specific endonuclease VapC
MEPKYLLDSDICILVRRGRSPHVRDRFASLQPGQAAISVIVYGELMYGIEKSRVGPVARQLLDAFIEFVPVLPLHADAPLCYGVIRADLERKGQIIGSNDLWIAAHALAAKLTLVTNNEREFARVAGLNIENWAR